MNRRMPLQRLNWFSSIQSREVAARLGRPLAQSLLQGVGQAPKNPKNRCCVGMADSAFVLAMGHIQGVMGPILDAPALLLKVQPLFRIQLGLGAGGNQPGLMELAFGANATIDPGDLQRSG